MTKPIYFSLEKSPSQDGEEGLIKKLSEDYLAKTFRDVTQKILDPEGDEQNDPYNEQEKRTANTIQEWFNQMNYNPASDSLSLKAVTNDTPPGEIRVNLNDIVSDYSNRILKTEETINESGEQVPYKSMELIVEKNFVGGFYE